MEKWQEGNAAFLKKKFPSSYVLLIGINEYKYVSSLRSPRYDVERLEKVLLSHGFIIHDIILNPDATRNRIITSLQALAAKLESDDRVIIYFAGHGITEATNETENFLGEIGYILPQDAEPSQQSTYISFSDLQAIFKTFNCKHFLLLLDCCYAGSFQWSAYRYITVPPRKMYREIFDRYVKGKAWQFIASASSNQKAVDVFDGFVLNARNYTLSDNKPYSPFALHLCMALEGDSSELRLGRAGIISAEGLFAFLKQKMVEQSQEWQSPVFGNFSKDNGGSFVFLTKQFNYQELANLPGINPYKELKAYGEEEAQYFFGRSKAIDILEGFIREKDSSLIVVSGLSGSGKSSLVKAGLLPRLKKQALSRVEEIRPGEKSPSEFESLCRSLAHARDPVYGGHSLTVLFIDQFEEAFTRQGSQRKKLQQDKSPEEPVNHFINAVTGLLKEKLPGLKIVVTVRSDFESDFLKSGLHAWWGRHKLTLGVPDRDDLLEIIREPAAQHLFALSEDLVDELLDGIKGLMSPLPLLSLTLHRLYQKAFDRIKENDRAERIMTLADLRKDGTIYSVLDKQGEEARQQIEHDNTIKNGVTILRKILPRLVTTSNNEYARRLVVIDQELSFTNVEDHHRDAVIGRLLNKRLLAENMVEGRKAIELSHDAVINNWKFVSDCVREVGKDNFPLLQKVREELTEYQSVTKMPAEKRQENPKQYLLHGDPILDHVYNGLYRRGYLNKEEGEFIVASRREKYRRRNLLWTGVGLFTTAVLVLSVLFNFQRNVAKKEERNAVQALYQFEKERFNILKNEGEILLKADAYELALDRYQSALNLQDKYANHDIIRDSVLNASSNRIIIAEGIRKCNDTLNARKLQQSVARQMPGK